METITSLPGEQWKAIDGYDKKYFVSSLGRIKSYKANKPHLLIAFPNNKGYERVALCKDGIIKHYLVSRLVA